MAAPGLSVSVCHAAKVEGLGALWRELEARSDATFFLTWDWIGCWLRQSGVSPYLLAVRDGGSVVALGLLQPSRQQRHRLLRTRALMLNQAGDPGMDVITIEYNGLLTDRRYEGAAMAACVDHLVRCRTAGSGWDWDELHLSGYPAPDTLQPLVERAGLMTWHHAYKGSWAVDLSAIREGGGEYLDALSANTRYQIRRAMRLYGKRGELAAEPARTVDEAMACFEHMKALHQRHWTGRGRPGSFAYPFFERFHRALITDCLPKGTVELVKVSAGGAPIGYVYNFIHRGRVCAYHTGIEYEADPKLKPGLVSHYLCIARHLRGDAAVYDFLAGDERYKSNLGQPGADIAHVVLQRPLLRLRAEHLARRVKQTLQHLRAAWRKPAAEPPEAPT